MFTEDIFEILYWYRFGIKSPEKMQEYLDTVTRLKGLQGRELKYSERHHIVPRCMNIDSVDESTNVIKVTAGEHFELHRLLKDCFEGVYEYKMISAYGMMCKMNSRRKKFVEISSEKYEEYRIRLHETGFSDQTRKRMSESSKGKNLGKKRADEYKERKRESMLGDKNHFHGKRHSKESRAKMSASLMGRDSWCKGLKFSDEYRAKISEATDNHGEKNPFYGKKHSEESRAKISAHTDNHGSKNPRFGTKLMNNSVINKCVPMSEVEEYERSGWTLGYVKKSS